MNKELNNRYEELTCLLCYFLDDGYYDDRQDIDTIKRYVATFNTEQLQSTLAQGREVLKLKPFPAEWVTDVANRGLGEIDENIYIAALTWLQWIINALEEEAKKAGKI